VTPLDKTGSFLDRACAHGQQYLVDVVRKALESESQRLAKLITDTSPDQTMSLFVLIPEELLWVGKAITEPLDVKYWEFGDYRSERFSPGAPGLSLMFENFGRNDLQDALVSNVLRRKNPADFRIPAHGLQEISRLLGQVTEADQELVAPFLDCVCTTQWLTRCFRSASASSLAGVLIGIATYQSPEVIARFWCVALGQRLKAEVHQLTTANPEDMSATVQFIGACNLLGWALPRSILGTAPLDKIGKLPSEVLAHNPDRDMVDSWQRQLWFGLRAIASLASDRLMVDQSAVEQTLTLWQANLVETSSKPDGTPHKINESMVRWLRRCASTKKGQLLPDKQPLWRLTGFPIDPRTFNGLQKTDLEGDRGLN
jgi:hypothetical protein